MLAASTAKQERLQQLRLNVALKQKEVEELRAAKAALEAKHSNHQDALLERLYKDKNAVNTIPLAQIGNVAAVLRDATAHEISNKKTLEKTLGEINLLIKNHQRKRLQDVERVETVTRKTGFTTNKLALKVQVPTTTLDELNDAIFKEKTIVTSMKPLIEKQERVLAKLTEELEKRKELYSKVMTTMNDVLVKEREINEAKEVLRALLVEHSKIDMALKEASDQQDNTTRALMQLDIENCKRSSGEMIEQRRRDDRIIKAQETRLILLSKRIAMIRSVLEEHNLLKAVDDRLRDHFNAIEKSPSDVEAVDDKVIEQYSSIEELFPDVETLPYSIYVLFAFDLEKKEKRLRVKQIMLREKEDTRAALQTKINELQARFDAASDQLHEQRMKTDSVVDQKVEEAHISLENFKKEYDALLIESKQLNARLTKQRDEEHQRQQSKQTEKEAADAKAKREAIRSRFARSTGK